MIVNHSNIPHLKELLLSLFPLVILPLEKLFVVSSWHWLDLFCVAMFVATIEIVLRCLPGEKHPVFAVVRLLILFLLVLFYSFNWSTYMYLTLTYSILFACLCISYFQRLLQLRPLFKQQSVRINIESSARFVFAIIIGLLMQIYLFSVSYRVLSYFVLVILAGCYVFLFVRAYRNRSMILCKSKESVLEQLIYGDLRSTIGKRMSGETSEMSALFQKVVDLFDCSQPFLDPDYGLNDLSRDVFTNKTYLSKAINVMSGRNFRQFINYYRVKHSISVINTHPKKKIEDVSKECGFHSSVTFTVAFKLNTGETPGEYAQRLKSNIGSKHHP